MQMVGCNVEAYHRVFCVPFVSKCVAHKASYHKIDKSKVSISCFQLANFWGVRNYSVHIIAGSTSSYQHLHPTLCLHLSLLRCGIIIIIIIIIICSSLFQSVVRDPLSPTMVPLSHIKTQLRELRYSSDVTQGLSQLEEGQQCVEQMKGGTLTLQLLDAQVCILSDYRTAKSR